MAKTETAMSSDIYKNVQSVGINDDNSKQKKTVDKQSNPRREQQQRHKHGNVDLLKEERRDLYDLLYGDDDDEDEEAINKRKVFAVNGDPEEEGYFSDESLENFDPYGLKDF
jgi:hypothetical protein